MENTDSTIQAKDSQEGAETLKNNLSNSDSFQLSDFDKENKGANETDPLDDILGDLNSELNIELPKFNDDGLQKKDFKPGTTDFTAHDGNKVSDINLNLDDDNLKDASKDSQKSEGDNAENKLPPNEGQTEENETNIEDEIDSLLPNHDENKEEESKLEIEDEHKEEEENLLLSNHEEHNEEENKEEHFEEENKEEHLEEENKEEHLEEENQVEPEKVASDQIDAQSDDQNKQSDNQIIEEEEQFEIDNQKNEEEEHIEIPQINEEEENNEDDKLLLNTEEEAEAEKFEYSHHEEETQEEENQQEDEIEEFRLDEEEEEEEFEGLYTPEKKKKQKLVTKEERFSRSIRTIYHKSFNYDKEQSNEETNNLLNKVKTKANDIYQEKVINIYSDNENQSRKIKPYMKLMTNREDLEKLKDPNNWTESKLEKESKKLEEEIAKITQEVNALSDYNEKMQNEISSLKNPKL